MVVPGTVVQVSQQRRRRNPTVQTLGCRVLGQYRRSLGTVQSWDGPGTVQSWDSLGTVQSWDSTVLGRSWDSAVLGQCSLGTVVVLGRYCFGTVVLGQYSLGTVVLGQWS